MLAATCLAGCATIVEGTSESVTIATTHPAPPAPSTAPGCGSASFLRHLAASGSARARTTSYPGANQAGSTRFQYESFRITRPSRKRVEVTSKRLDALARKGGARDGPFGNSGVRAGIMGCLPVMDIRQAREARGKRLANRGFPLAAETVGVGATGHLQDAILCKEIHDAVEVVRVEGVADGPQVRRRSIRGCSCMDPNFRWSDLGLAAIDEELDAVDEACVVRCQEQHRLRDLVRLADAACRDEAGKRVLGIFRLRAAAE